MHNKRSPEKFFKYSFLNEIEIAMKYPEKLIFRISEYKRIDKLDALEKQILDIQTKLITEEETKLVKFFMKSFIRETPDNKNLHLTIAKKFIDSEIDVLNKYGLKIVAETYLKLSEINDRRALTKLANAIYDNKESNALRNIGLEFTLMKGVIDQYKLAYSQEENITQKRGNYYIGDLLKMHKQTYFDFEEKKKEINLDLKYESILPRLKLDLSTQEVIGQLYNINDFSRCNKLCELIYNKYKENEELLKDAFYDKYANSEYQLAYLSKDFEETIGLLKKSQEIAKEWREKFPQSLNAKIADKKITNDLIILEEKNTDKINGKVERLNLLEQRGKAEDRYDRNGNYRDGRY